MPFVYLLNERRWIPRNSAFLKPLDPPMTEVGRWNKTCLNCHATGVRPNWASEFDANTEVSNFGIACEACHGPGEKHVAAYQNPLQRYPAYMGDGTAKEIVNPSKLDPHRSAEVCGQCHAILNYKKYDFQKWARSGFSKSYFLSFKEWADDQLRPGMRGNRACTQCHSSFENEEALVRHTHHPADSSGSSCYNCHMSYTTYGLLKAIRSHTVESPSVAVTLETGRPNACNQCHLDKPLKWTADLLKERYDIDSPELPEDHRRLAASLIWLYKGDAAQRALMAWSMGWAPALDASDPDWMPAHLAELLRDPYDAVRFIALRSLRRHAGFEEFEFDHLSRPGLRKKASEQVIARWQAAYSEPDSSPGLSHPHACSFSASGSSSRSFTD